MSISLKDVEILKGGNMEVLAKKPEPVKKEAELSKKEQKITKIKKQTQLEQLQELSNKIKEMEEAAKNSNTKIKPIVISEPVEVKKAPPMIQTEEPMPKSLEEQYKEKETIIKNDQQKNIDVMPSLPVNIPYKKPERVNSILPFNWKNAVQRQNINNQTLDLNKYLKGRKY
jgi:hypothetical protein